MKRFVFTFLIFFIASETYAATVVKSIGTSGRDYSTITLWEADLDNGAVYGSGDTAQGEIYNDSAFDESVTINGGGTVGLAGRILTVPVGQRHDGTAGTGARMVASASRTLNIAVTTTVEWLEWDLNGNGSAGAFFINMSAGGGTVQQLILHDIVTTNNTTGATRGISLGSTVSFALNNIVYDITSTNTSSGGLTGIRSTGSTANQSMYNNTVYKVTRNSGTGLGAGFLLENFNPIRNNIAVGTDGTTSGTLRDFTYGGTPSGATTNNLSEDDTADDAGTDHVINVTVADLFVSTTDGSEDLHLKAGSPAIDLGSDRGTTPTGVNFDIDNYDRDAEGVTWDIGADEYVAAAGGTARVIRLHSVRLYGIRLQ